MRNYVLSCCSTADISREHFEKRGLSYICFHYTMDGKTYPDDLGETMPFDKFYEAMVNGADTTTSQVNISEYLDYFTSILEQGKDLLHVTLSSGISGSYNSARNAGLIAQERFPERKVYVVDSLAASSGFGLLMDAAADKRDEGLNIDELRDWLEENKLRMHHWFFSSDLTFFVKGGRISKAAGIFGGVLGICPLMNVDVGGHLVPRSKVRTKKRVIKEIVDRMAECADDGENYAGKVYLCNSACHEDAEAVAALVKERFPNVQGEPLINSIGTVIGSHTGPGTVALFFWGKKRED